AKYFGATKWGVAGAVVGGIVGLFTGLVTLLILPIAGAIVGEFIAGKQLVSAGKAGWGALLGNLAGMIGKLFIGLAMVIWWLVAVPSPLNPRAKSTKATSFPDADQTCFSAGGPKFAFHLSRFGMFLVKNQERKPGM